MFETTTTLRIIRKEDAKMVEFEILTKPGVQFEGIFTTFIAVKPREKQKVYFQSSEIGSMLVEM